MVTMLPALRQVREDLVELLDRTAVEQVCRELGYRWRDRQLDPYTTLHLFILQVLYQNTAMTHLPHLAGERFSASAYCQARQRLPVGLFERLVDSFTQALQRPGDAGRWHGHRVMLVDGSGFSMPDTAELQACFGQAIPALARTDCQSHPLQSRRAALPQTPPQAVSSHDSTMARTAQTLEKTRRCGLT